MRTEVKKKKRRGVSTSRIFFSSFLFSSLFQLRAIRGKDFPSPLPILLLRRKKEQNFFLLVTLLKRKRSKKVPSGDSISRSKFSLYLPTFYSCSVNIMFCVTYTDSRENMSPCVRYLHKQSLNTTKNEHSLYRE